MSSSEEKSIGGIPFVLLLIVIVAIYLAIHFMYCVHH